MGVQATSVHLGPDKLFRRNCRRAHYNRTLCKFQITITRNYNPNKNRSVTEHNRIAEADLIVPHDGNIYIYIFIFCVLIFSSEYTVIQID